MVFYIGKMQIVEVLFLFISKMLYLYTHKVKLKYDSDRKLQIEEIYDTGNLRSHPRLQAVLQAEP